jgi:hypothetical protein
MCLTLFNAMVVLDHQAGRPSAPGYTRTRHHIGRIGPGDLWCPDPDGMPHTVITVSRRAGKIVLTDQFAVAYHYLPGTVIGTAVPDPRIRTGEPRQLSMQAA